MQSVRQFMPNVTLRGNEAFETALGLGVIVALDIDQDLRRATVIGYQDSGHADQTDARIAQFAFDQGFNLLAQGFAQTPAMNFDRALFHSSHPTVKRMRISENRVRVLGPEEPLSRPLVV